MYSVEKCAEFLNSLGYTTAKISNGDWLVWCEFNNVKEFDFNIRNFIYDLNNCNDMYSECFEYDIEYAYLVELLYNNKDKYEVVNSYV